MIRIKRLNPGLVLFMIAFLWFIVAFMLFPNIEILRSVFFNQESSAMDSIKSILSSPRAMRGIKNSFILAVTLTCTTTIVGILEVLFLEFFDIKLRKLVNLAYMIPLIFGGVMVANGYIFTYGSRGFVTTFLLKYFPKMNPAWFSGYGAVIFLMTFACTSTYMIFFRNSFKSIDYQTIEAARGLGASNTKIIFQVVLPTLKPILLTCTILLFQTGLMAMSAPLMIGGKQFETISPLILTFTQRPTSRTLAAVLSLFLGLIQMILLYVLQRNERKGNFLSISKVSTRIKRVRIANPLLNVLAHLTAYAIALINLIPFLVVLLFSFTDVEAISTRQLHWNSFSLANYKLILTSESAYRPFLTSVFYATAASVIVVGLMLVMARFIYKRRNRFATVLEMIIYTPWVFPGLMFALGLVITYSHPHTIVMNNILTGSLAIMLIAYIIVMMPNTFRFLKASFFSVDQSLEDAAKNLGAKPSYTFLKIVLPIVLPTVLAMLAINFNGKLSEYDLSVFLYNPIAKPIGVVIRNNSSTEAGIEGISLNFVYSVILMTINALVFFFVYADGKNVIKNLFKKRKISVNEN
ncbi:MAG TPA: iron ABC transporter permease [Candidatus Companilactobacillus pullicola]|uniref:Iron ABC transporter permease n=1 Tax=Candidatus Companilactobacillus pullicola TaxID=2838523 RepID=A0A9D1ZNQ2_9LACO|nr:iron ABC transporter permease [Candidatus Companilactobacillus pullicola]